MSRGKRDISVEEEQFIEDSLKVSSYEDKILDAFMSGSTNPNIHVPDFSTNKPMRKSASGFGVDHTTSNEGGSLFSMFDHPMFKTAGHELPEGEMPTPQTVPAGIPAQKYLSSNQIIAIKKYPALIDLLGTEQGDFIVKEIAAKVNQMSIQKIAENSKAVNSLCQGCVADKQNVKAFFVNETETKVCVITASGTFRGDEVFYYNFEKDNAQILRKNGEDYDNVTSSFNMIHEAKEKGE